MIADQVGFAGAQLLEQSINWWPSRDLGSSKNWKKCENWWRHGVVKDIDDNQIVMGYPAIPLKNFIKNNKNTK